MYRPDQFLLAKGHWATTKLYYNNKTSIFHHRKTSLSEEIENIKKQLQNLETDKKTVADRVRDLRKDMATLSHDEMSE